MFRLLHISLILPFVTFGQNIKWEKSLKDAFLKAKAENKTVFVEYYSPGCPYCQKVSPIFSTPEVAKLYNDNFINYQLNVDTPEANEFSKTLDLDVYALPYFLFFKADSSLIHAREVSATAASVSQPATMVLEKVYTAENYPSRFAAGQKTENFLSHYAIFTRIKKNINENRSVVDALWAGFPESKRASATSWAILKKGIMDIDNGFVNFWLNNLDLAKSFEASTPIDYHFSRILNNTLFSERAKSFDTAKFQEIRDKFGPALGDKVVFGLTWEREVLNMLKAGNEAAALKIGEKAFDYYQKEGGSIVYLSQIFNTNCKSAVCYQSVGSWLEAARDLQITKADQAAYYMQLALLKKNENKKGEALDHIQRAIKWANEAKVPTNNYIELKKEIENL